MGSKNDTQDFLDIVFADNIGYVAFGLISGSNVKNPRAVDDTHWFAWPSQRQEAADFCGRNSTQDVYVSPMLFSQKDRKADYVVNTPVVWCDADDAPPENFELPPSIIVTSSPRRYHLYWILQQSETPLWTREMARIVAYAHYDEGAGREGWGFAKYLRVPGTKNTKPTLKEAADVTVEFTGLIYTRLEMEQGFGAVTDEQYLVSDLPDIPKIWPARAEVFAKLSPDPRITQLLEIEPITRNDWSRPLWALECMLFRRGLSRDEVFVLVHGCACDKYTRDGRPDLDLWKEVCRAQRFAPDYVEDNLHTIISSENRDTYAPEEIERPLFLTLGERQETERFPTFIDRYVEWGKTKTNADPGYHEFGAMSIMSTVLSDFGHAVPQFGIMRLNLWFMLLGVTTRTYKTTARNLMLSILKPLSNEEDGYDYLVGSDATTEGLLLELSTRPGRSTLFYRDEAQAMFADSAGGKSYMSGLNSTFTELYDGHVRGRLRATGAAKRIKEVEASFNLYLMGVPGRVAEILNPDDFASGFLARFLYVIGEPEERSRESMLMKQQDENEIHLEDMEAIKLRKEIATARTFWEGQTTAGSTLPIRVEDTAWERYNEFVVAALELAADDNSAEMLEPAINRMEKSVLKLSCLLAMMDGKDRVDMGHMLTAIKYGEDWFMGMVQISRLIATSKWSGLVHELVAFVVAKGKVQWAIAYRKFMQLKPNEFKDLVTAAVDAGMVNYGSSGTQRWLSA